MNRVKLNDIATIYNGNSINKSVKQQKYMNDVVGWNYIATKDVDFDGTVTYKNGVVIPFSETKFKIAPAGTVFVCSEGGSAGRKTAIITEDVCFGNKLFAIVNSNKLFLEKYVYYYTRFEGFLKQFKLLASTLMGGISSKNFGNIEIPLPPLPEQERIVTHIEELFSELDRAVETLRTTKQQLAVYRQAVLKEAFEGDYPKVQLKEISTTISGYAFKSKKYTPDGEYIVVKIGNVKERHFDFSRDLTRTNEADGNILDKYLLRHGDCLITLTGSRGKRDYGYVTMIDKESNYLLNQRVAALRFDETKALPEYFQYYLSSPDYRNKFFSYETGNVGQGNVGIKALWEPTILLPSIEEQKKIVEEIESRLSVCESIELTVDTALAQADAMRQSILKQAFEGGF